MKNSEPKKNRPIKLLVVDDEKAICDFLYEFFGERGYTVYVAATRDSALAAVNQHKPDLVLLDILLHSGPNQNDGIEVLREIKKQHPSAKVLMVTAVEDVEIINQAMSLGASDYLIKPLSLEYLESSLTSKIEELLPPQSLE